jgi:hypothetical protein
MRTATITVGDLKAVDFLVVKNELGNVVAVVSPNDLQVGTRTVPANLHVSGVLSVGSGTIRVTSNDIQFGDSARIELASTGLKYFDISSPAGSPFGSGGGGSTISTAPAQPLGSAAAGSTGEVSDAGHVHALPTAAAVGADLSGSAATATSTAAAALAAHAAATDPHPSTLTTAGDILYHNGTTVTRLPAGGTSGMLLTIDTTLPGKLTWACLLAPISIDPNTTIDQGFTYYRAT